ncbi:MAG: cysteine desulfurase family protein [Rhizobiaceae bacterium]
MAKPRAYLDHNASAPLLPAAREAMVSALALSANPSSVHREGRGARRLVEEARAAVAALAGGRAEHVVFTSGATEAASTLLTPDWRMGRMPLRFSRLYVSAADHPCLLAGGRFAAGQVVRVGADANGVVDLPALRAALSAHDRDEGLPLVAMHWVNNETGVVQPMAEIGRIVREAGGTLVVDAVQAAGRIALDIAAGPADCLILSAHKIGGPAGVGAIVAKADLMMPVALVTGGGQEKGFRAGTENLAGIAGFGAAAREALRQLDALGPIRACRDAAEAAIRRLAPEAVIFGEGTERVCNTTFFAVPGLKAETAQIAFDLAGVALSAGSACSSGKVGPSHVLKAMGVDDALGALRVSVGPGTTRDDIALFETALAGLLARRGAERAA